MKQVIHIHGGSTFPNDEEYLAYLTKKSYDPFKKKQYWYHWLESQLPEGYQMIVPDVPDSTRATYAAWKIWFEKVFPYLSDEIILMGHSLGAIFVLKYLVENDFPKKLTQLHIISPEIEEWNEHYLGDFVFDVSKLPILQEKADQIYIYHSKDDPVISYSQAEKLFGYLPKAKFLSFEDRGHFGDKEFPELLENILK